jgi:hypothetical protein
VASVARSGDLRLLSDGVALLDIIYVVAAVGLFGLVALVAWGVEKL